MQPVFVQSAGGTQLPQLRRVLVAFGNKIAFENTLSEALDSLFGGDSGAATGDESVTPTDQTVRAAAPRRRPPRPRATTRPRWLRRSRPWREGRPPSPRATSPSSRPRTPPECRGAAPARSGGPGRRGRLDRHSRADPHPVGLILSERDAVPFGVPASRFPHALVSALGARFGVQDTRTARALASACLGHSGCRAARAAPRRTFRCPQHAEGARWHPRVLDTQMPCGPGSTPAHVQCPQTRGRRASSSACSWTPTERRAPGAPASPYAQPRGSRAQEPPPDQQQRRGRSRRSDSATGSGSSRRWRCRRWHPSRSGTASTPRRYGIHQQRGEGPATRCEEHHDGRGVRHEREAHGPPGSAGRGDRRDVGGAVGLDVLHGAEGVRGDAHNAKATSTATSCHVQVAPARTSP